MIRVYAPQPGELVLHVDDDGARLLATAATEAIGGRKVMVGDPGAMLVVRHIDFHTATEGGDPPAQRPAAPEVT